LDERPKIQRELREQKLLELLLDSGFAFDDSLNRIDHCPGRPAKARLIALLADEAKRGGGQPQT
jgi:hypothetical protein